MRAPALSPFIAASLGLLAAACSVPLDDEQLALSTAELGTNPLGVKSETICFSVHNLGIPGPIALTGTRFSQRSFDAVDSDMPAILLLHGAVETREIFDGGKAGAGEASSFARLLAKEGYLVVTVDRAGYGDSPYQPFPGAGWTLTYESYVAMTHELVTQLRAGSYTLKDGDDCGSGSTVGVGSNTVILGGHSIGGGEAMLYATRYHDIDALISFGWNNTGTASIGTSFFVDWIVPQFVQGNDYVTFFPPGGSGVSEDCVLGFFSQPIADTSYDPLIVDLECANDALGTAPSGELSGTTALRTANLASLAGVGQTPALLTFADLDTMVSGAHNPAGDPDYSGQEVALWEAECNCDVSSYTLPGAGHAMFFPDTMPELVAAVDGWLDERGLSAR